MLAQGRKRSYSQAGVGGSTAPSQRGPPVKKAKKPLAKRVRRLEKITKVQNVSRGLVEFSSGGVLVNAANPLLIKFSSQQGAGHDRYINSEAFAQTMILSANILSGQRNANFNSNQIRVILGFCRYDAIAVTAADVLQDLFGTATPSMNEQYMFKTESTREGLGTKYIIKSDKVHQWNNVVYYDGSGNQTSPYNKCFKEVVSLKNVKMEWPLSVHASASAPEYNCPFFLVFTANGTGHSFAYQWRQWFTHQAAI